MDSDGNSAFMRMIEKEYESLIKNYFRTVANRNLSREDNEDIFQDTIIKCNEKISGKDMTEEEMKSYLYRSLKTNGYRESEYARNKEREDCSIPEIPNDDSSENILDLNAIYAYINEVYGKDARELIKKRIEGYTIHELEIATNKKGLNYIINKIFSKVRSIFK